MRGADIACMTVSMTAPLPVDRVIAPTEAHSGLLSPGFSLRYRQYIMDRILPSFCGAQST